MAVFADNWNCTKCHRGDKYRCPNRDLTVKAEAWLIAGEHRRGDQPMVFAADECGICPHALSSPWAGYIWQAYQWQEAGGDLGVSFVDCPKWLLNAFNILASERFIANKLKRKLEEQARKK